MGVVYEQLPLFDDQEDILWRAYFQGYTNDRFHPMWTVKCSIDVQEQWYVSGAIDLKALQASAKKR